MALYGFSLNPCLESVEVCQFNVNLSTTLIRPRCLRFNRKPACSLRRNLHGVRCSSVSKSVSSKESQGNDSVSKTASPGEEEPGHVTRFEMSDFMVLDRVSVGLAGRADEVIFEAIVKDSSSPLYNSRVVLRQLTSAQAQRRGRRAIEVLKKLVGRRILYHSYSMQVYGYVTSHKSGSHSSFTLVHGYHGSFSLRHWLQQPNWLPTLEATLALDEESVRRVGDDSVGGPAVSRQLRLTRILMRDLLIGVNYLHCHGIAHTELRLENVHISPIDRHIKVGILGNAADFYENGPSGSALDSKVNRRQMMIAFDMRCVGFMMAKMVLSELMDPSIFTKFKHFLMMGNDPSCLREFLLPILTRNSATGNVGLQILDRNWGAGWNLLSLLLTVKGSKRISCLDALRHPFLCGPRWRVVPSMDIIRWGLGSTAVRITEEYIYRKAQRGRLAHFIELMEMLNPHSRPKNWLEFLPGKWRLLYSTGRHIGLTLRQPPVRVLIGNTYLTIERTSKSNTSLLVTSEIGFTIMVGHDWPHDKRGIKGKLQVNSSSRLRAGKRLYLNEAAMEGFSLGQSNSEKFITEKLSSRKWRKVIPFTELPSNLPVAKLLPDNVEITMTLDDTLEQGVNAANIVQEIRTQVPPEMFELSNIVCGTYVDSRMLVLRGVNGSALIFTRSCRDEKLQVTK
ncbi:probable plastid-lipid-associated protein 14, chloroplastic [Hibiscus syriacus]|uniref:probable plastid-lipid-associated protein 14, chloroplastic n=1 Tax=Hibiscus syriacus TaxID=106335 RepID=UPI001924067B|nr:probable plastid-lipid-associated protein 14, chloroplastic [Hibiscus syriacus]XP_039046570.1 probable plastid-lipid-associated protein 14, chloroplastic [Hibiscus syriacus]